MKKLFSAILAMLIVGTQSSTLVYNLYASSEILSEQAEASEELVVESEVQEPETVVEEQPAVEEKTEEESGNFITNLFSSNKQERSVVKSTNGATTMEIVGYDEAVGMDRTTVYDVNVTVDFGTDITSTGKELHISLPDGMRFELIPVRAGSHNTGVDSKLLGQISSDDPLYTAITSIDIPSPESGSGSTFGDIKYSLTPGTKSVTLTFRVKLDSQKITESHVLHDQIKAYTLSNGATIGEVNQEIKANVDPIELRYARQANLSTTEILPSDTEDYIGYTFSDVLQSGLIVKNMTMYIYYPEGSEYIEGSFEHIGFDVTNDSANHRLVLKQKPDYLGYASTGYYFSSYIQYKFPSGTPEGRYYNPQENYVEYEDYKGDKFTVIAGTPYAVDVISEKENKIRLVASYSHSDDNDVVRISQGGVTVNVANQKGYTIDNQIVEWEIEDSVQSNVISFPYDMTVNVGGVTKFMYQTHQNSEWRTATQNQLDVITYNNSTGIIEVDDLNIGKQETISDIKIWVGSFSSGFSTGSTQDTHKAPVGVYGNLILPANQGTVKFTQYDENNEATTVSSSKTFRASETDTEMMITPYSSARFTNPTTGATIGNVSAGETFTVKGSMGTYSYPDPSRNLQIIKDPVLYIRETKEYTIDLNSLKLQYLGQDIDFTYEEINKDDGSKVYKITTSPDVEVGNLFDSEKNIFVQQRLSYSFSAQTDQRAKENINNNNLVLYGSNKYDITAVTYNGSTTGVIDMYDMDGDESTEDSVMANASITLQMKENTNVLVDTYFSLAGSDDKIQYIPGDDSTAAHLTVNDLAEYTAVIYNNSGAEVPKFDAYIPVPKTDSSFGAFFQDDAFTWDMSIAEAPQAIDGFKYYYSTDATEENFTTTATYVENPTNLDDVVMIKAVMTTPLQDDEEKTVKFQFKVNETFASTIEGEKAGTLNVFKIFYDQITQTYSGVLNGTPAAVTYRLDPEVEVPTIETFVGEPADLMADVVALDYYNVNFELVEGDNTTVEASTVPVADGKFTTAGTYEATYTVHDAYGGSATVKRLIKVHGPIVVDGTDQTYWVTDPNIAGEVGKIGTASYLKAGDTVGSTPVLTTLDPTYEVTRGLEDFSEAGTYDVVYSATDEFGRVAEKQVLVTVLGVGDVSIKKSVTDSNGSNTVSAGETLNYTITISNETPYTALNTVVRDSMLENIPSWVTFNDDVVIGNTNYTGDIMDGTLTYDQLDAGETFDITYSFTINELPGSASEVANVVTTDGIDPDIVTPGECTEDPTCDIVTIDFEGTPGIKKSAADENASGTLSVGEKVTYTLAVSTNDYQSNDVPVRDSLLEATPSWMTFNNDVEVVNGTYTGDLLDGTFVIDAIAPGEVVEITYSFTVGEIPNGESGVSNIALADDKDPTTVTPGECEEDPSCDINITDFEGIPAVTKDAKDADGDGSVAIGESINYTISITTNEHASTLVPVRDSLLEAIPSWATYNKDIKVSTSAYTGDILEGTLVLDAIAPGEVVEITYSFTVNSFPSDAKAIGNVATTDNTDPNTIDKDACKAAETCSFTETLFTTEAMKVLSKTGVRISIALLANGILLVVLLVAKRYTRATN